MAFLWPFIVLSNKVDMTQTIFKAFALVYLYLPLMLTIMHWYNCSTECHYDDMFRGKVEMASQWQV